MNIHYAVIGAGRQGTASAYDLAKNGEASYIIMIDIDKNAAYSSAARINRRVGNRVARGLKLDVRNQKAVEKTLETIDACISAVPYYFNLKITKAAIKTNTYMTDMGGNAQVIAEQLKLNGQTQDAGITVVPDCGMEPGMAGSLAAYGISQMDEAWDVFIWGGGLPQKPMPP